MTAKELLRDVWPEVALELEEDLREAGEEVLAESVDSLTVFGCCGCGDSFCLSFYTAPPPKRSWLDEGPHENILLERGLILDVVSGRIVYVEDISGDDPDRKARKSAYQRACDVIGPGRT